MPIKSETADRRCGITGDKVYRVIPIESFKAVINIESAELGQSSIVYSS